MAKLEPKEISLSEINNGNEYENGDIVDAKSINSAIEASAYAQGKANEALDWVKGQGIPYHIGAIYMSTDSTSPASIFGGTWEQIKDRFLLGSGDSYGAGTMGGYERVKLLEENLPETMFSVEQNKSGGTTNITGCYWESRSYANGAYVASLKYILNQVGNNYVYNQPHENMPPYLAVYIWKRTA